MDKEFTIVTAFFDIKRHSYAGKNSGRNYDYIKYFEFWARIQNKMVIYCEPEYEQMIKDIRASHGLQDRTTVIAVEDKYQLYPKTYERMRQIEANPKFERFRYQSQWLSNNAGYNYVVMLKYWCLNDAVERGLVEDTAAWVDFGYDHDGEFYLSQEEFAFTMHGDVEEDKIYLYALKDINDVHVGEALQIQYDVVAGAIMVVPKQLAKTFLELTQNAVQALFMLDCMDNDQQLALMAVRQRPELFHVNQGDFWWMDMKLYWGGEHLTTIPRTEQKNNFLALRKLARFLRSRRKTKDEHIESYLKELDKTIRHYWNNGRVEW